MKIEEDGSTLHISDLTELSAQTAGPFRAQVQSALSSGISGVEVDLAGTHFVDSCGLASLCSLRASAEPKGIAIRLLNPEPPVHQLLELTQMHELFEIVSSEPIWTEASLAAPAPAPALSSRGSVAPLHFI
jgi:anti-sigma B factor antagonist